jgi:hypothetical protein
LPIDPDAGTDPDEIAATSAADHADAQTANPTAGNHDPVPPGTDPATVAGTPVDVHAEPFHATADEAANHAAEVDADPAEPDPEEYRA